MSFFKTLDQGDFDQEDFLDAVREGGVRMERATSNLINHFNGYSISIPRQLGLDREEGIDAFADAVMVLINYIRLGKLDERYKISTYLYRLTRNKSIDRMRKRGRLSQLEEIPEAPMPDGKRSVLHDLLISETFHEVLDLLDQFKGKCKELLLKWGFWGYSMKEISQALDFKSPEVARTQKSRCLKKLNHEISDRNDFPTPSFN